MLADRYQQEYGQYRDKVGDWQTERDFLSGRYDSERNMDYGMWGDARDFAYTDYRNGIADQQWQQQYEESIRQFNEQMAFQQEQFAWQQAQAEAAAAVKSGGGSGSGSSNKTESTSYKDTNAYSRAVSYAKAGAQSRRTANLLNGFVQRGEITAAQAEQIMKELY